MTEDQIERVAERKMDKIDELFLSGYLTETEYHTAVESIQLWVDNQLKRR